MHSQTLGGGGGGGWMTSMQIIIPKKWHCLCTLGGETTETLTYRLKISPYHPVYVCVYRMYVGGCKEMYT